MRVPAVVVLAFIVWLAVTGTEEAEKAPPGPTVTATQNP